MKFFVLARSIASATLIAILFSSGIVKASDEDSWQLLQKAAAAARVLSYKGIFVCQTSKQIRSVEITHLFDGQNEFARNVVLDGSPREVFNHGGSVVIYNPQQEKVIIEKRRGQNMFPAMLPTNLDSIKVSYNVRQAETERVAGRLAQVLVLLPKDGLRYSYRFWVDIEYGLLLKSVMYNHRDEAVESMRFTQLGLMSTDALDWFKPKIDHSKNYVMEHEAELVVKPEGIANWEIRSLPAGYRKVDLLVRKVPGKDAPVTHVVFSDGLASVSLFIEQINKHNKAKLQQKNMLSSAGNTNFYAHINHGHLVTAVGDVPEAAVVQIANSVVFKR